LYIKASEFRDGGNVRRVYLSGAVASYLLSLGSKEIAVTFPLALLLWDVLIRRLNGATLRKTFCSDHLPFWIVLLAWAAWAWWHPRYSMLAQFSLTLRPLWDNVLSEIHAVIYALILFLCPWKQNFDHDLPELHSLFQWPLPLDLLLLFGLAAAALVLARRIPLIAFGVGWFFVQLLPTSLIPRADLLSERNLYLASFGLMLVIVVLCARLMQRIATRLPHPRIVRFGAGGLAALLVLVSCLFTYQRNLLYRDQILLWSDTVHKSPNKARPHNNLGHAYALRDDWDRAIEEFRIAVQLNPDYALAQKNLRDAYLHHVGRQ
jgi:tetratricopeptide (TPR) repeat protein